MTSWAERLRQLSRLYPGDQVVLGQAWALFLLVDLGLRLLPFKRLLAIWRPLVAARAARRELAPARLPRLVWLVEVAGRHAPVDATCLKTALVLGLILGRRGVATSLRIGVSRREGTLVAHAWLEHAGAVIVGSPDAGDYAPLFPAA